MYGLTEEVIQKIQAVFSNFSQIEKAVIYGSRAMGSHKNGSDIDIVFFGDDLHLDTTFRIEDKLDELNLPYTFDLAIFHNIDNIDLKDHIERVGKLFYEK